MPTLILLVNFGCLHWHLGMMFRLVWLIKLLPVRESSIYHEHHPNFQSAKTTSDRWKLRCDSDFVCQEGQENENQEEEEVRTFLEQDSCWKISNFSCNLKMLCFSTCIYSSFRCQILIQPTLGAQINKCCFCRLIPSLKMTSWKLCRRPKSWVPWHEDPTTVGRKPLGNVGDKLFDMFCVRSPPPRQLP